MRNVVGLNTIPYMGFANATMEPHQVYFFAVAEEAVIFSAVIVKVAVYKST